jgi:EAL domain-containing protein (putative c-di-GMP-specific phosphodiesterase class I)
MPIASGKKTIPTVRVRATEGSFSMKEFEHAGLTLGSHFQPIYSLAHRRTIGMEALLRARQDSSPLTPAEAFYSVVSPERRHQLDLAASEAHAVRFSQMQSDHPCWLFLNIDAASLSRPERAKCHPLG